MRASAADERARETDPQAIASRAPAVNSDPWWRSHHPLARLIRAQQAFEKVDPTTKPTVTVRCGNEGCGHVLGYLYGTEFGPLWAPLVRGAGRSSRDKANKIRLKLLLDRSSLDGWDDPIVGCRSRHIATVTSAQLIDAWETARRQARHLDLLTGHPELFGTRPGEPGTMEGDAIDRAKATEILANPESRFSIPIRN